MKKLMALMCAVLVLGVVSTEAQAQRRGGNDDEWRRNRGGDRSRDRGNRGGDTRRDRGNSGDRRDGDVRNPRRDDRDYRNPRRDDRRPDDRDYRNPRTPNRNPRRVDRDYRDVRNDRYNRYHHRPNWNRPGTRYTRYTHRPNRDRINHSRRFYNRYDYHRTIPYRYVYWDTWIRYRVSFGNGYVVIDGYPYYVYNGYRHRYSYYDTCDYDLVDGYSNTVEHTFYGYTCAQAYDLCSDLRDDLNYRRDGYRYFCSEKVDFSYGRYSHWDYEDDFYYDVY